MTIWEYLKEPHPWFDTANYEPFQIALFLIGALLWVFVYVDVIRDIFRLKVVAIPLAAICLNFGFEVTTSLFFVPNMGTALVVAYWAWMLLDVLIVGAMFRYGWKQIQAQTIVDALVWLLPLGVLGAFFAQFFFITTYDLPMAPLSGYIINLVMSMLFVGLLFGPGVKGQTWRIGWGKFLGTLLISIMFFTKYPDNYFLLTLYILVALFDIWYIRLLNSPRIRSEVAA